MTQGLELTNKEPFKDVLIHGIVRDSQGRKMSKTLGNGIDPLEIVDKYGADSLRFSVLSGTTMGNDIRFMPEKLEQASNFANKIWNAAKFITNSISDDKDVIEFSNKVLKNKKFDEMLLKSEDKWIINKLNKLILDVNRNFENYDLGVALDNIYNFIWNEFCDWYIEMVKPRLYSDDKSTKVQVSYVLDYVFRNCLKLLHPFMPFVTSEIYGKLVNYDGTDLMISNWPETLQSQDFDEEEHFIEKVKKLIVEIRNIRNQMNVHPSKKSKLIIITENGNKIKGVEEILLKLGFASKIEYEKSDKNIPNNAVSIVSDDIKLYIPFEELVDVSEEIKRLEKEKQRLESEVERGEKMLSNSGFINKAPESKVNEEKEKLANYKNMLENVKSRLESFRK